MEHTKPFIQLCKKYGVNPDNIPVEVLSFEEGCKLTGENPKKLPIVTGIPVRHRKHIVADYKLTIIAEAMKSKQLANYTDGSDKYHAVFVVNATKKQPSGSGLSYRGYDLWFSLSYVGVRFCFPNYDMAKFFGCHFLGLHTDFHLYT